jgi:hypothetical protein
MRIFLFIITFENVNICQKRVDIRETLVYYDCMNEQNIQLKNEITIPWDELDNLTARNAQLLINMASGLKPADVMEAWNSQNPQDKVTLENCYKLKSRYKEQYSMMHGQVLKHIRKQYIEGAVNLAIQRAVEQLVKYQGQGKQGTLTETINAAQCLDKLLDKYNADISQTESTQGTQGEAGKLKAYLEGLKGSERSIQTEQTDSAT